MEQHSAVGVIDKAVLILEALSTGPRDLASLCERTALPRATAHRLAMALEVHGLVARDGTAFTLGRRLAELADPLVARAAPVLLQLSQATGESAQLYLREGERRRCVAAHELSHGLRDTVPVGAVLPMTAGSAAQVLLAWSGEAVLAGSAFGEQELGTVRRRGWAESVSQRAPGVASVSAPVRSAGAVVAALGISGPIERLGRSPGKTHAAVVVAAAEALSA